MTIDAPSNGERDPDEPKDPTTTSRGFPAGRVIAVVVIVVLFIVLLKILGPMFFSHVSTLPTSISGA